MVTFYTSVEGLEPTLVCYPYIVVNPWSFSEGMRYVAICRDRIKSILIDTGVHKLFDYMKLQDYPDWYVQEYVRLLKRAVAMFGNRYEILYVIPDIPCDYPGREHLYPWNVQRTIEYIELFRSKYIDMLKPAKPIAVVQGRRDDIRSVIEVYHRYEHLYNEFEIIGLGPVCQTKRWSMLANLIVAFDRNVSRSFHCFGVHIRAVEKAVKWRPRNWRSFDSSAYSYVNKDGYRLVRSRKERAEAFLNYVEKLKKMGIVVE